MAESAAAVILLATEPAPQGIVIVSRVHALADGEFTAEVRVERRAGAGQISMAQSRSLRLAAGETGDIARSQLSFGSGDLLDVNATVMAAGQVISRSRLTIAADTSQTGDPI